MPRRRPLDLKKERKRETSSQRNQRLLESRERMRRNRASTSHANSSEVKQYTYKMLYCVIANCTSTTNRWSMGYNPYVKFFSFPAKKNLCEKWIERCCQNYRFDAASSKICSLHFRPQDFIGNDKTELQIDVIPSINLPKKFEPKENMNKTGEQTLGENANSLSSHTLKTAGEENVLHQAEIKQEPVVVVDPLYIQHMDTERETDSTIKQEPNNDQHIGLEMDIEEVEIQPINNAQEQIKRQKIFIVTQPSHVTEKSSFKEDDAEVIADPLQSTKPIIRESPSFKSTIQVRDIRTLTDCKKVPVPVHPKPPAVPLKLREVPRSEALKLREVPRSEALSAIFKKTPTLISTPQNVIKQYPVKKTPLKAVTNGTHLNSFLKVDVPNQNVEHSGNDVLNQMRKRDRVISVNQANRENGSMPTFITLPSTSDVEREVQNVDPSHAKIIDFDDNMELALQPDMFHKGDTSVKVKNCEATQIKCKPSSLQTPCVLCAGAVSTLPTYNIESMIPFVEKMVDVKISSLNSPFRACRQCIRDMNVALRFRGRVRGAYRKIKQNKGTCLKDNADKPLQKVFRTYGKFKNIQKNNETTKQTENVSVENSTSYSQKEFAFHEQTNEKESNANPSDYLISYSNKNVDTHSHSEIIDIDLINDDDQKRNLKINKGSQSEQERDIKAVEQRESILKNSQIMKIIKKQSQLPLQEINDCEKEDSGDDLNCSKKSKVCFCRANIPRDILLLPETQLKREFALVKYIRSRCLRCFQRFPSPKGLKKHILRRCSLQASGPAKNLVDGIETRTCDLCQYVFRSHIDVLIHKDNIHNKNNCPDCLMRFKDSAHAQKHIDVHKTDDFTVCLYCSRLVSSHAYRVHRIMHGLDWWTWRRQRCNKCNGEVLKKEVYTCTVCAMQFTTPGTLKKHSWAHKKRDFTCKVCSKVLNTKSSLKQHLRNHTSHQKVSKNVVKQEGLQTKTKPYKCELCNASFSNIAIKTKHLNQFHVAKQMKTVQKLTMEQLVDAKKAFKCDICNMYFFNDKVRDKHLTTAHNISVKEETVVEDVINCE